MTHPTSPIMLYGTSYSGHTHRVVLLLRMLKLPYELIHTPPEARQTEAFKAINPYGQVPVICDGDLTMPDSNAIMVYLVKQYAPHSPLLPQEPVALAHVQRWLSIAAGEVAFGPTRARAITQWKRPGSLDDAQMIAKRLFRFMDQYLQGRDYLVADHVTLADLACYSYIAHAHEGSITLEPYANVCHWLSVIEALPDFLPMELLPIPATA